MDIKQINEQLEKYIVKDTENNIPLSNKHKQLLNSVMRLVNNVILALDKQKEIYAVSYELEGQEYNDDIEYPKAKIILEYVDGGIEQEALLEIYITPHVLDNSDLETCLYLIQLYNDDGIDEMYEETQLSDLKANLKDYIVRF